MADAPKKTEAKKETYPDTPSGKALAAVGKDGDGDAYQAEKRKHRWG